MGKVLSTLPPRFWEKVNKSGPIPLHRPELGPCHLWMGSKSKDGYGRWRVEGKTIEVYRSVFEAAHGPLPKGFEPDHLCRVRACCNLTHLEAVSHAENMRRGQKTHCLRGHPFDEENTYMHKRRDGRTTRYCRACFKLRSQGLA